MDRTTKHHGSAESAGLHAHQGTTTVSVLSGPGGPREARVPGVFIQVYTGSMAASFDLQPAAARQLAACLIAAADAADRPDTAAAPDTTPVALYREPEAA